MSEPIVGVIGVGATGARAARQLAAAVDIGTVVLGGPGERPGVLSRALGDSATIASPPDDVRPDDVRSVLDRGVAAVVLAGPAGSHVAAARNAVERGVHVISTSDAVDDVNGLLALGPTAIANGAVVVAGAAMSPGLTCVLAAHVAGWVDEVDEIHVARFGTGGPACARQHHSVLSSFSHDWRDGEMVRRAGGSGRELCAFPDPVGSVDCYRAGLAETHLLHAAFGGAQRITSRQAANRRQRLTAWLPMLRRPHPEGRLGAVRVEVRGRRNGTVVTEVTGAIDRPAVAAGAVAGLAARWAVAGRLAPGADGLAGLLRHPTASERSTVDFLDGLAILGVRAAVFEGSR